MIVQIYWERTIYKSGRIRNTVSLARLALQSIWLEPVSHIIRRQEIIPVRPQPILAGKFLNQLLDFTARLKGLTTEATTRTYTSPAKKNIFSIHDSFSIRLSLLKVLRFE